MDEARSVRPSHVATGERTAQAASVVLICRTLPTFTGVSHANWPRGQQLLAVTCSPHPGRKDKTKSSKDISPLALGTAGGEVQSR
jgi:hypothetical protein